MTLNLGFSETSSLNDKSQMSGTGLTRHNPVETGPRSGWALSTLDEQRDNCLDSSRPIVARFSAASGIPAGSALLFPKSPALLSGSPVAASIPHSWLRAPRSADLSARSQWTLALLPSPPVLAAIARLPPY